MMSLCSLFWTLSLLLSGTYVEFNVEFENQEPPCYNNPNPKKLPGHLQPNSLYCDANSSGFTVNYESTNNSDDCNEVSIIDNEKAMRTSILALIPFSDISHIRIFVTTSHSNSLTLHITIIMKPSGNIVASTEDDILPMESSISNCHESGDIFRTSTTTDTFPELHTTKSMIVISSTEVGFLKEDSPERVFQLNILLPPVSYILDFILAFAILFVMMISMCYVKIVPVLLNKETNIRLALEKRFFQLSKRWEESLEAVRILQQQKEELRHESVERKKILETRNVAYADLNQWCDQLHKEAKNRSVETVKLLKLARHELECTRRKNKEKDRLLTEMNAECVGLQKRQTEQERNKIAAQTENMVKTTAYFNVLLMDEINTSKALRKENSEISQKLHICEDDKEQLRELSLLKATAKIKQAEYDAKLKQNKQENMKLRTQVNGNRKVEEFMRELIVDAKYKAENLDVVKRLKKAESRIYDLNTTIGKLEAERSIEEYEKNLERAKKLRSKILFETTVPLGTHHSLCVEDSSILPYQQHEDTSKYCCVTTCKKMMKFKESFDALAKSLSKPMANANKLDYTSVSTETITSDSDSVLVSPHPETFAHTSECQSCSLNNFSHNSSENISADQLA